MSMQRMDFAKQMASIAEANIAAATNAAPGKKK